MAVKGLNNVDPDQLASLKPDDLDLHCFQNRIYISILSILKIAECNGLVGRALDRGSKFNTRHTHQSH